MSWLTAVLGRARYAWHMRFNKFELGVLQLASRGLLLTVANVAVHLGVEPTQAETWLDQMARTGRLDVELNEDHGFIYYRVRGWTPQPPPAASAIAVVPPQAIAAEPKQKSCTTGALLALFLPGVGLLYAAPYSAVLVATLVTLVATHAFEALPIFGGVLSSATFGLWALVSAYLGVLYVRKFNDMGERAHLDIGTASSSAAAFRQALR